MPIIDSDTHVDETEDTWAFMLPGEKDLKPIVGYPSNPDPNRPMTRYWLIDGERHPRFTRNDTTTRTTVESRELLDVKVRLRDMDSEGVQTHVIYPTMFLIQPTLRPDVDVAIKRSYNRWLGQRCEESGGRLRWACLPPVVDMEETKKELRWAKEHGAVGVLKKGDKEAGKYLADPYFYDLWKEAEALDLSICFHTGSGIFDRIPQREFGFAVGRLQYPVLIAFQSLIQHRIPQQFPSLRFGFIEAGAGWLPYVIYNLARRLARPGELQRDSLRYELSRNILNDNNMFVTCQVDEDLRSITGMVGEDNILIGSDYTHADQSMERDFQQLLAQRAEQGDISRPGLQKIMYDNPRRFYAL